MKAIAWEKKYELGVDFIDKEHKELFSIINRLLRLIEDKNNGEWVCRESIKFLKNHTIDHFRHEEEYMISIGYDEYEIHKRLHDNFQKNTLPSLEKELEEMHYSDSAIRHFLGVIIGWLVSHTKTSDLAIIGKNVNRWTDVPHEKEIDFLEQSITQKVFEMCKLKTKTISVHYEGENFGETIGIRFVYCGEEKERWEIVINYEEKLLRKLVGNLLNAPCNKMDDMAFNITRHFARQFIEEINECFPSLESFKLEHESLITYEQLARIYERAQPSCSLLFDTGEGYFSFSVSSSDPIRGKITSTLDEENVTSEIWKYLNTGKKKKKILVVDDSELMRKNITNLLGDDYEVSESASTVSAIKNITINRPDLILLDYEMPICDGKQTMEMLRSDEDTANIPIMFLTGRCDADSVKKVMSLKPMGYLLKTMPTKYIRNTIDGFFVQEA